jgi:NAD-dependent SIR2 family protein deacetylase
MDKSSAVDRHSGNEIRRAFLERSAVLFCGAGISVEPPATLPDWKTLRDETIKAVAGSDEALVATLPTLLQQNVDGGIGQSLAPELVATIVRSVVPNYFQSLRVLDHDQPNRNHALIARLARDGFLRYVLSTNFDQLIETAFLREGVPLRVLRSDTDFAAFHGVGRESAC